MTGFTRRLGLKRFGGTLGGQISDAGYKFSNQDRGIIDAFLAALEAHSHEGGTPLADPVGTPSVTLDINAGLLAAGLTLYYRVAFVDAYGLETAASSEVSVQTPLPIDEPSSPSLTPVVGGTLPPGAYYYAISFVTTAGEETLSSPIAVAAANSATASVQLILPPLPAGASGVRIYRQAPNQSQLYFLAQVATLTYTDNGSVQSTQSRTPAGVNTTNSSNRVLVTVPDLNANGFLSATVAAWRIYRAYASGQYGDAALVQEVVERQDELNPASPLTTTWYDVGEALRDGLPLAVSTTFKPPPAVPAGSFQYVGTNSGLTSTTVATAIDELAVTTLEHQTFAAVTVAASTTAALLLHGAAVGWVMPDLKADWNFDGLTVVVPQALTAGTVVVRVLVNGVLLAGSTAQITLATGQRKARYRFTGADRRAMVAGDEVSLQVTTDAAFAPTQAVVSAVYLARQ